MPQIIDYKSPKTGKSYSFDWNKDTDPTPDDYDKLKAWVDSQESNVKAKDDNSFFKDYQGGLPEINKPGNILTQAYNRVAGTANSFADQILGPLAKSYDPEQAAAQGEELIKDPVNAVLPIKQTIQDVKDKNYGGALANVGMVGLGAYGAYKGIAGGFKKPPTTAPEPTIPLASHDVPLPEFNPNKALSAPVSDEVPPTRFISQPSGEVLDTTDPSSIQFSRNYANVHYPDNIQAPETPVPNELRPERTGIFGKNSNDIPIWDFDETVKPDNTVPEQYNPPRSFGIGNRDFLSGEGGTGQPSIYTTVPNRLRPEAPNVTGIRNLAGSLDVPQEAPPEPTTVNIKQPPGKAKSIKNAVENAPYTPFETPSAPPKPSRKLQGVIDAAGKSAEDPVVENANVAKPVKEETPTPNVPDLASGWNPSRGVLDYMEKNPTVHKTFLDWINRRAAGDEMAKAVRDKYSPVLDQFTGKDLPALQERLKSGEFPEVKQYFDSRLKEMNDAGVNIEKKENYLPQLWADAPDKVKAAFENMGQGKRLSTKAPFMFQSIFEDYAQGIDKGKLTPKMGATDLLAWYEHRSNRLMADRQFFDTMKEQGLIKIKGSKGSEGMVALDSEKLPKAVPGEEGKDWAAKPLIKHAIENYLQGPNQDFMGKLGRLQGRAAGLSLSGTLFPKTPILSGHGLNTAWNGFMDRGVKGAASAIKSGLPFINDWDNYFKEKRSTTIDMARNGVNLTTPDVNFGKAFDGSKSFLGKAAGALDEMNRKYYREPLFNQMIPKMMIESWEDGIKRGIPKDVLTKKINTMYGHENLDTLFRDKHYQDVARSFLFAPSWLESRVKMLDLTNPAYQRAAGRVMGTYVVANLVNKANSGHFMWNNDSGREFDVAIGKGQDGKDRYLSLSNAFDMYKVPAELATDIVKNHSIREVADAARNKAAVGVRLGSDLLATREDMYGNPLITTPTDKFGHKVDFRKRLANTAADVSQMVLPSTAKGLYDLTMGNNKSPEEAAVEAMQLPIRYSREPKARVSTGFKSGIK